MEEKDYLNELIGELEKAVEANKFSKSHEIRMEIIKMDNFFATEYAIYLVSRLY